MSFHRFVDPAWTNYVPIPPGPGTSQAQPASGGLVYDRVNIASGAVGLNPGEAIVNPPPPAGPTPFTYFVGFSDPGESGNPNRGLAALAENTDYLDDVVHRDVGVRARVFIPTPLFGPAVNSYTFAPGDFPWLGSGGEDLSELFTITEGVVGGSGYTPNAYFIPGANSNLYVTGTTVAVGSGFVPGAVTLTFNTSTPLPPFSAGIWLHYRTLSSAALIPPDPLGPLPNGIDGNVTRFLYRVDGTPEAYGHASWASGDQLANAPFHSLWKLNHYGLNQTLLRDTDPLIDTVPSKISYMTPNAANAAAGTQPGFWGLRNSSSRHSPTMVSAQSQTAADFEYLDPVNALWTAWMEDVGNAHRGGSTGFVVYGQRRMTLASFDAGSGATQQGAGYASFLHLSNHPQSGGAPAGTYTYIPQDAAAVVGNVAGEARIDISPGAWFWQNVAGEYRSAVALGYDLIEVQFSAGAKPQTYVIVGFFSDTVAVIQNLDGTVPTFVFGTPCTVRWRSMVYGVSDGVAGYDVTATSLLKFDGLFYAAPHKVDPSALPQNAARGDYSAKLYAINERGDVNALGWGGFRATSTDVAKVGQYYDNGLLRGDGGIEAKKFIARSPQTTSVLAADVTLDFAAAAAEADYHEYQTVDLTSSLITAITAPSLNTIANDVGRVFRWVIRHKTCALQIANLSAWPGVFVFENLSDAWFSNALNYVDIYTGVATYTAGGTLKIFMSVQRFNAPLGHAHDCCQDRLQLAVPVDSGDGCDRLPIRRSGFWRPSESTRVHRQSRTDPDSPPTRGNNPGQYRV